MGERNPLAVGAVVAVLLGLAIAAGCNEQPYYNNSGNTGTETGPTAPVYNGPYQLRGGGSIPGNTGATGATGATGSTGDTGSGGPVGNS